MDDLVFRTRALAQAHPLSAAASTYVNTTVARERTRQPAPEMGFWAGAALTVGYCLRKVEEVDRFGHHPPAAREPDPTVLDRTAQVIAGAIRTGTAERHLLNPEGLLVAALDRLIAGEIDRRLEHWRDTIPVEAERELEEYLAWWVIRGYALRAAEVAMADTSKNLGISKNLGEVEV
ncbi:MAG: hypothetical protein Q8Q52_02960 [Acidimicrobiia bacterium]|nr:hypothetical protein [Acidimicrobiia bacterium]